MSQRTVHRKGSGLIRVLAECQGSTVLLVLILTPMIFLMLYGALDFSLRGLQALRRLDGKFSLKPYETHLEIVLTDPERCIQAVKPFCIHNGNPAELKKKVNVTFQYPASQSGPGEVLLAPGMKFGQQIIGEVGIADIRPVASIPNAFLGHLMFSMNQSSQTSTRPANVPIYLVTDPAGNVTSCQASRIVEGGITVDDHICRILNGPSSNYNPVLRICL